jgi:DNA invertase Pin-like site-specific DNA recombinase
MLGDIDDPYAMLMLSVMGAVAEFERALMLERQREGIAWPRPKVSTKAGDLGQITGLP